MEVSIVRFTIVVFLFTSTLGNILLNNCPRTEPGRIKCRCGPRADEYLFVPRRRMCVKSYGVCLPCKDESNVTEYCGRFRKCLSCSPELDGCLSCPEHLHGQYCEKNVPVKRMKPQKLVRDKPMGNRQKRQYNGGYVGPQIQQVFGGWNSAPIKYVEYPNAAMPGMFDYGGGFIVPQLVGYRMIPEPGGLNGLSLQSGLGEAQASPAKGLINNKNEKARIKNGKDVGPQVKAISGNGVEKPQIMSGKSDGQKISSMNRNGVQNRVKNTEPNRPLSPSETRSGPKIPSETRSGVKHQVKNTEPNKPKISIETRSESQIPSEIKSGPQIPANNRSDKNDSQRLPSKVHQSEEQEKTVGTSDDGHIITIFIGCQKTRSGGHAPYLSVVPDNLSKDSSIKIAEDEYDLDIRKLKEGFQLEDRNSQTRYPLSDGEMHQPLNHTQTGGTLHQLRTGGKTHRKTQIHDPMQSLQRSESEHHQNPSETGGSMLNHNPEEGHSAHHDPGKGHSVNDFKRVHSVHDSKRGHSVHRNHEKGHSVHDSERVHSMHHNSEKGHSVHNSQKSGLINHSKTAESVHHQHPQTGGSMHHQNQLTGRSKHNPQTGNANSNQNSQIGGTIIKPQSEAGDPESHLKPRIGDTAGSQDPIRYPAYQYEYPQGYQIPFPGLPFNQAPQFGSPFINKYVETGYPFEYAPISNLQDYRISETGSQFIQPPLPIIYQQGYPFFQSGFSQVNFPRIEIPYIDPMSQVNQNLPPGIPQEPAKTPPVAPKHPNASHQIGSKVQVHGDQTNDTWLSIEIPNTPQPHCPLIHTDGSKVFGLWHNFSLSCFQKCKENYLPGKSYDEFPSFLFDLKTLSWTNPIIDCQPSSDTGNRSEDEEDAEDLEEYDYYDEVKRKKRKALARSDDDDDDDGDGGDDDYYEEGTENQETAPIESEPSKDAKDIKTEENRDETVTGSADDYVYDTDEEYDEEETENEEMTALHDVPLVDTKVSTSETENKSVIPMINKTVENNSGDTREKSESAILNEKTEDNFRSTEEESPNPIINEKEKEDRENTNKTSEIPVIEKKVEEDLGKPTDKKVEEDPGNPIDKNVDDDIGKPMEKKVEDLEKPVEKKMKVDLGNTKEETASPITNKKAEDSEVSDKIDEQPNPRSNDNFFGRKYETIACKSYDTPTSTVHCFLNNIELDCFQVCKDGYTTGEIITEMTFHVDSYKGQAMLPLKTCVQDIAV